MAKPIKFAQKAFSAKDKQLLIKEFNKYKNNSRKLKTADRKNV